MKSINFKDTTFLVKSAIIAAVYFILTIFIPALSYGPLQFRISEIMVLLVFYNKRFIPGLLVGCFLANMFSPLLLVDMIFGTLASFLAFTLMIRAKNLFIASLYPVLFMIIPALETYFLLESDMLFVPMLFYFCLSEFLVVSIIGFGLFKILEKNKEFMKYVESM